HFAWRRVRDSNSRYPFGVYTLSRRAPSTTRTTLLFKDCKSIKIFESERILLDHRNLKHIGFSLAFKRNRRSVNDYISFFNQFLFFKEAVYIFYGLIGTFKSIIIKPLYAPQ